ncbi:MAG: hypothetical protein OHK0029_07370 [Armatimonadaceae bacterium]
MQRNKTHGLRQWNTVVATALALTVTGGLLVGCGSGSSSTANRSGNVTRGAGYSEDAVILASREASGAWIPAEVAAQRDADLKQIRAKYPNLTEIHARPVAMLNDLLVKVDSDASWTDEWKQGDLALGETGVDPLLREYRATKVKYIFDTQDGAYWYTLTFDQPLNVQKLTEMFRQAGGDVRYAEPNHLAGDGDNIIFRAENGKRIYDFSKGWGDCPAGCIERRHWVVTIETDGTMTLEETGSELPGASEGQTPLPE